MQKHDAMIHAWDACTKMVETSVKSCESQQTVAPPSIPTAAPNWDALANSFASLSVALTWGSILLAVAAVIGGIAWGKFIARTAENEARTKAAECADQVINEWLNHDAPGIIRSHVEYLQRATLGNDDDGKTAADAIGEAAG